jgi:integrase
MASISTAPGGYRTIQFVAGDGKRRTIRLGKAPQRIAEEVRIKVEALNAAAVAGLSWDAETARWVASLGVVLADKLAAVGLIPKRQDRDGARLGDFIDAYIARRTDVKTNTASNLRMFGDRLIAFFGKDKNLADIKRSDADDWALYLKREKYAEATVGRTIKGARQLFKAACRAELITRNPFEDLKAACNPDKERQHFVSHADTQRVLDACPDAEWRLLVALARFGGLRCPSEHLALTWPDVDWDRERFRVDSPKTGERWVPIFPELRPYLEQVFEQAPEGAVNVITRYRDTNQNLRTQLNRIVRRAGLVPWPKPFQNMRASRETELAALYPLHVVCTWIGNSMLVANKHYLQTTEEDFRRAAKSGAVALQNAVQQPAAPSRTDSQDSMEVKAGCEVVREGATGCKSLLDNKIRLEGFEPPTYGSVGHCSIQLSYRRFHPCTHAI